MLVISENLKGLVKELKICPFDLVDEFSINITLSRLVRPMRESPLNEKVVRFTAPFYPSAYFEDEQDLNSDLVINPRQNVLACSNSVYSMPPNYFGLIQTKGSLARLFVSVTANDGQVEPGYTGKITLELSNHSNFPVAIPVGANIAQLFIFRCTTDASTPYNGRYQNAKSPTIYRFE